jgi:hypothetical protein
MGHPANQTAELIDAQKGKYMDGCTGACLDGSVVAWLLDLFFL